jgi:hypothetical protein
MYIVWANNIFVRQTGLHPVLAAPQNGTAGAHHRCAIGIEGNQVRNGCETRLHDFACSGISEIRRESLCQRPTHNAHWVSNEENSTMTNFKFLSVAVILSTAMVTPVFAQQAVSEPGMQAFYQSLGVGSQSSAPSAMASARGVSYAGTPAKHISAKHKM